MFLIFPTTGQTQVAINVDHIQRIEYFNAGVTRLVYSQAGDGSDNTMLVKLSFDDAVRWVNDAMTAGV